MTFSFAAQLHDLLDDEPLGLQIKGHQIALYRVDGEIYATGNVCTHQFALLSDGYLEDGCIECPLHQAKFDVRTGAAVCGPANVAVPSYAVRIEGESILVDLPQ